MADEERDRYLGGVEHLSGMSERREEDGIWEGWGRKMGLGGGR